METRIRKLYDRFLEGKATKEEINEIYDRITATPEELKEFREYEKFWEQIHKPSEEVLASLADVKQNNRKSSSFQDGKSPRRRDITLSMV